MSTFDLHQEKPWNKKTLKFDYTFTLSKKKDVICKNGETQRTEYL